MPDLSSTSIGLQTALLSLCAFFDFLLATLLLRWGTRLGNKASGWLAIFLILCSFYLLPWLLGYAGWYGRDGYREFLFFLPCQQLFFLGPIVWLYVRSQVRQATILSRRDLYHFLPGIAYLLYSLMVFVVDVLILDEFYFYANGRDKDLAPW